MILHAKPAMANQRHRRYIKRSFQRRFITQVGLLMMLGCAAFGAVVYLYGTRTITTAFVHSKLRVMSTGEFLLPALAICTLAVAGVVAVLAAGRLLVLSHRIAGPLYRFRMVFKALVEGNFSIRASIRKHDYLHTDARALNEMIEALETRIRGLEDQTLHLGEDAAQLKGAMSSGAKAEAQQALERLESQLEGLKKHLAHFAKAT